MHQTNKSDVSFLTGWIGEKLVAEWFKSKGFGVEVAVQQKRGTENAISSGDIDLIARKRTKKLYVEVKCWSDKYRLTPSWFVEYMLERNKLNTLFESHKEASNYMLIYRFPSNEIFRYEKKYKYIQTLISKYKVPRKLIQDLSGKKVCIFVEKILEYLVHKNVSRKIKLNIVYFRQIIDELKEKNILSSIKCQLSDELSKYFDECYMNITGSV